jgi:uncharacterized protein (DUF2235 family)
MPDRAPRTHILLIDGTFSRLTKGQETNIGLIYRLLEDVGQRADQSFGYHPGVQGKGWWGWFQAATGIGLNAAISESYARLASLYKPGDRVILLGYSRGAYAVRSLAGWIGRIGLLKARHATHRRVARSFRYYEQTLETKGSRAFSERFCHRQVQIEMIGAFDTVRALGLPYPVLNRLASLVVDFHDHRLSPCVRHAFHALALDETRVAYVPIPWTPGPDWPGRLEQVWFAGAHADVGGQVWRKPAARGLSNIPLVWMISRLERCDVRLPTDWRQRFELDPAAPALGNKRGWGKLFVMRAARLVRSAHYESVHRSVAQRCEALRRYRPKAEVSGLRTATHLEPGGPKPRFQET